MSCREVQPGLRQSGRQPFFMFRSQACARDLGATTSPGPEERLGSMFTGRGPGCVADFCSFPLAVRW